MTIYKLQARSITTVNDSTWTLLTGSDKRFDHFRIFDRIGRTALLMAFNSNPGENYMTIPAGAQYADSISHNGGIYVKSSGGQVVVEFESKTE